MNFDRILIANRGEIALRVMRSAHALGYQTVAVYSDADAGAPHTLAADRAVRIGGAAPSESYLNIPALIDAARRTGADAVHPGYGFLAENAAFAQACRDAGLVFIGPSPEAIRAMGDKAGAKALMRQAGVPCIPGWQGDDQSDARLAQEAARIGWPVMIKATAGGGGRGMRRVERADGFIAALQAARSEATNAFGDGTVLLERAIDQPRHVEIQVLADRHGTVLHLGERDCSVQRRHQKIIEEAPSPAVDAALRERMGQAAVAAARAIGYEGAGTLEFLLDAGGAFYFMEMNTRLQVEHPVTEAITGQDIVAWQIRVAAGERLDIAAEALQPKGHAIEVRLCAEDVPQGFLPAAGTLLAWEPAPALRVEHALASGSEIPPFYDSMVAKLIAHGATREEARRRLLRGLEQTVALGVATNRDFLLRCLAHPAFAAGQATTAFVDTHRDALLAPAPDAQARLLALAAVLLAQPGTGGAPVSRHAQRLLLRIDGQDHALTVTAEGGAAEVVAADATRHVRLLRRDGTWLRAEIDGLACNAAAAQAGSRLWLQMDGCTACVEDRTLAPAAAAGGKGGAGSDGLVRAAMAGRVVAVHAQAGDSVRAGQPLLTLEAMKMQHVHAAPLDGTVAALHAQPGQQVAGGSVLAQVAPAGTQEGKQ